MLDGFECPMNYFYTPKYKTMSTKHLSILLLLLLPFICLGQRKAKTKLISNIEFSGGFLFDIDKLTGVVSEIERETGEALPEVYDRYRDKKNYAGFNYVLLGLGGERGDRVYGMELEALRFTVSPDLEIFRKITGWDGTIYYEYIPDLERTKTAVQLSFYYGKKIIDADKYQLIAAPLASIRFLDEMKRPKSSSGFPVSNTSYMLGLGLKLKNQFWISKKMAITVGTRFLLADLGIQFDRTENPSLPLRTQRNTVFGFDFIRDELVLQLGLQFKI